ncbi:MAG: 50S ribosomal protein L25/general stress protein Ctc [candidate division Zixibacteria bacterium]|nr:50S ribosomal protein L25/general stress protein Ctc [candidate division Zixibacteria bacterium]
MKAVELTANKRETSGKGAARKLRMQGRIPAVYYGSSEDNISLDFDAKSFEQAISKIQSTNVIVSLDIGGDKKTALLKFLQRDPIDDSVLHADFYGVSPEQEITLRIPVRYVGSAIGVKDGGVLQMIIRELEISCKVSDIPEFVEVDVTDMQVGDSIHVEELELEKVEILIDPDRTMVTVVPPTIAKTALPEEEEEEEGEVVEEEEGEEPTEPEVITEKKKEEEEG